MEKGSHHSEEARKKLSESRLGKSSWNKGKHFSEESKDKMREAKLGKQMSDDFKEKRKKIMQERWSDPIFRQEMSEKKKGANNPNYQKPMSEEQRANLSIIAKNRPDSWRFNQSVSHLGNVASDETKKKMSDGRKGDKAGNWKGGITTVLKAIHGNPRYKEWCLAVLRKHEFRDVFMGMTGVKMACHHILPVNIIIKANNIKTIDEALACKLIWDPDNGICMKRSAHHHFHNIYGDSKNIYELTMAQLEELYDLM
jgi:hypothetical protein